jgi:hypothetical protein
MRAWRACVWEACVALTLLFFTLFRKTTLGRTPHRRWVPSACPLASTRAVIKRRRDQQVLQLRCKRRPSAINALHRHLPPGAGARELGTRTQGSAKMRMRRNSSRVQGSVLVQGQRARKASQLHVYTPLPRPYLAERGA